MVHKIQPEGIGAMQTISQWLAKVSRDNWSTCFKDIIPKLYQEFKVVFSKESFNELPDWKQWDHTIELVLAAKTFSTKVYPLSPVEQKQFDKFIKENLKSGHIFPSKSPMVSPIFFIKMKEAFISAKTTGSSIP